MPTAVALLAVVVGPAGCQFDETQFQHDCRIGVDVSSEAVCRDGRWVEPSDADDTRFVRSDADVVGRSCTEDGDCGPGVCVDRECRPCRADQTRSSSESCGYKGRGSRQKVCREGHWEDGDCVGVWYRSCRELLELNPAAENGFYELDPDGPDGESPADEYFCVMDAQNPEVADGWTRVAFDRFEAGAKGWEPEVGRSICGEWGWILGGYGKLGDETIGKTFELPPVPGDMVRLYLEVIKIDSWDPGDDYVVVRVDGEPTWRRDLRTGTGSQVCGRQEFGWYENKFRISRDLEAPDVDLRSYEVEITGVTDEGTENESWGIDNVAFLVR